jgi:hypothetical protein
VAINAVSTTSFSRVVLGAVYCYNTGLSGKKNIKE